jgi:hypothetical protein
MTWLIGPITALHSIVANVGSHHDQRYTAETTHNQLVMVCKHQHSVLLRGISTADFKCAYRALSVSIAEYMYEHEHAYLAAILCSAVYKR